MSPKESPAPSQLTEVELELMSILWRIGPATVREVQSELPEGRDLAYTSVSTMLRILEKKGAVAARKEGRGHVYGPRLTKESYESSSLRRIVSTVFDGAPTTLVRRLIADEAVSDEELRMIRAMLDERLGSS